MNWQSPTQDHDKCHIKRKYQSILFFNLQIEASLASAKFTKLVFNNASLFDETDFPEDVKRQFKDIKNIGSAALEDESKIEEVGMK